jgi:hypothetical protein
MSRQHLRNRRANTAFTFEFEGHKYRASAGRFDDGRLAEIFLDCGKPNTQIQSTAETAAILTSLALQHGIDAETIKHAVSGPVAVALDHFLKVAVL